MKSDVDGDRLREVSQRLSAICLKAERMLDTTIDGFVRHSMGKIKQAEEFGDEILEDGKELTGFLVETSGEVEEDKERLKDLVAVVGQLQMTGEALKSMLPIVRNKIKDDILFSNKAIEELKYLFENTRKVLKSAGDVFLTRNPLLVKYVLEEGAYLNEVGDNYAMEHEDRLISGVCVPKASPLFISLLDCLARVNRHTMRAVDALFSTKEG
ncbi:MAG: hypothetical protein ACE5IC_05540 [Candidatus Brocadiales bacterium]